MNKLRHYDLTFATGLVLHDKQHHIDPFTDQILTEQFTEAYFKFLRKLTNLTYHCEFSPAEETHLRELFENVLRTHERLR
jgi:hypothetical protein